MNLFAYRIPRIMNSRTRGNDLNEILYIENTMFVENNKIELTESNKTAISVSQAGLIQNAILKDGPGGKVGWG